MSKATITINEIARLAGVSKKSVSRVINNERGVSEQTRQNVQAIMNDLGYEPDRRARALASSRSFLLGLAYNNPNPTYVLELLAGCQNAANARGYEIVMHQTRSEGNAAEELIRFMRRSGCDGLILTPPLSESAQLMANLADQNWHCVRIAGDNADFSIPQIRYNDRTAALSLAHRLLELGHKRLAFIGGPERAGPTRRRLAGIKDALTLHRQPASSLVTEFGDFTFESGRDRGRRLLTSAHPPTAIMCANDEMAAGVYQAAFMQALNIPGDVSISGFDDSPVASHIWPLMTSVRQPVREMAAMAVNLILDVNSSTTGEVQLFEAQIIERESVGPAPPSGPQQTQARISSHQ